MTNLGFVESLQRMPIYCLALLSLFCISCSSTKQPEPAIDAVTIVDIRPRYIPGEHFKRVSEYMTGREQLGKRILIRSDPEERSGYYFVLILDRHWRELPPGSYIVGEFYTPHSLELQTQRFEFPSQLPKNKELFIGLTGRDWPDPDAVPAAWQFTVKQANGKVLASRKSYLWKL